VKSREASEILQKRILFLQNEARKLLKTKDRCGKNSQNEPETKLAKLLKIRKGLKNEPDTKLDGASLSGPSLSTTDVYKI